MEEMTGELIERLTRLERRQAELQRSNRRLRIAIGAVMLTAGALLTMAQTSNPVGQSVDAQQFVLHDSTGKIRGGMGVMPDGSVGFDLEDPGGRARLTVDLTASGIPGIDLYDQNGTLRATLALGPQGTPGFGLYDASGKLRTSLDVPAAKTPGLAFYHTDGKPSWGAP
ncbi:MAG TPA: hypothetical protein VMU41_13960 [Candidatus Binataceae bacterium]|nr:hypothetical protein [Candidatus Binataceae bacterium]